MQMVRFTIEKVLGKDDHGLFFKERVYRAFHLPNFGIEDIGDGVTGHDPYTQPEKIL